MVIGFDFTDYLKGELDYEEKIFLNIFNDRTCGFSCSLRKQ